MKELVKELEELLWEIKLWQQESEDAKRITDKIWQEIIDIIERYKKKTHTY